MLDNHDPTLIEQEQAALAEQLKAADERLQQLGLAAMQGFLMGLGLKQAAATA